MHAFDAFFHFALLLSQISLESFCFLAWAKKEGCASFPANAFHFSGERFLFCKYNTVKGNYQWKHRAACPVCGIYLQGTRIYAYSSTSLGELMKKNNNTDETFLASNTYIFHATAH